MWFLGNITKIIKNPFVCVISKFLSNCLLIFIEIGSIRGGGGGGGIMYICNLSMKMSCGYFS